MTQASFYTRRAAFKTGVATAATVAASTALTMPAHTATAAPTTRTGGHQVFQHGVASGDPYPNSVILWTRVSSHPGDFPGSDKGTPTQVGWQVATDEGFNTVVASGAVVSSKDSDQTIKIEATGLAPYTRYFYRFVIADGPYRGQTSPVGKTLTAPAADADVNKLRLALFSCSNWEAGYFTAYRDMAQRGDIDFAVHVGDYIYEYGRGQYTGKTGAVRHHQPPHEIRTLADYRLRHGTYHTDEDLQAAHAACPWVVTWDDHEVANDSWEHGAENHSGDRKSYYRRRDCAVQAYLEWLPVRATTFSQGGHLYRNLRFGKLLELSMLDLRTYRNSPLGKLQFRGVDDPKRSMMGSEQFQWLSDQLTSSSATWNAVGNSVMISPVLIPPMDPQAANAVSSLLGIPQEGVPYNTDQWDGFAADRRRLYNVLHKLGKKNTVFLTGDIHSSWGCDLPMTTARYPHSEIVGVEIVCTSVNASNIDDELKLPQGNGITQMAENALTAANKHVRFLDFDWHGYSVVEFTPRAVRTDWLWVDNKLVKNGRVFRAKSMEAQRGHGLKFIGHGISPASHRPGH